MNEYIHDPIDNAYYKLEEILYNYKEKILNINSEEDTRTKIINPFFIEILNWSFQNFNTEEYTGEGYVDYKFSINNSARLIVEAKKDSTSLNLLNRSPGKTYKLNGPVLSKQPQPREGILQSISYCGAKNAELACVTNGNEWIIFRGSRLGDGQDTLKGMAFVFPNIDSIKENFSLFYDLLAPQNIERHVYRSYFQEAEGQPIRAKSFSRTVRPVNGFRLLDRSDFAIDVERIMTTFFRRLSGDSEDEMLEKCFVVTRESQIADYRIARIADDLAQRVKSIETTESIALTEVIKRVQDTHRNEFILLVGTKGAGKSTFTDRFFKFILPRNIIEDCVVIKLNVGKSTGNPSTIIDWLNKKLLTNIEKALYGELGPTYEELQGLYFDEYLRWQRGPYKFLYEDKKSEFKQKFGEYIEKLRYERREEYIKRLLKSIVGLRKKVPCLTFDNTDHFSIEFQEKVFQYARSIYETTLSLIIIPITDKTSWQLSKQGALQSFESESFYLPTPTPKVVISKRIDFLEEKLKSEKHERGRGYFFQKGIHLSLDDLQAFVFCLQQIFLDTGYVSKWIGNLANNDIRRCLQIVCDIIGSPYLKVDQLVKAYIANSAIHIPEHDIKRAIIRKGYNYYPTGQNEFVQNVFSLSTEFETTPILSLRILRLLRDAKHHDAGGLEDYVTIEQVLDYFQALGIERRATSLGIDALLKTGLCFSYDPTCNSVNTANKIQLSPSGLQHLLWGTWDESYIGSMMHVTPIGDESTHEKLKNLLSYGLHDTWAESIVTFINYLVDEDNIYIKNIVHSAYVGQYKIIKAFEKKKRLLTINN